MKLTMLLSMCSLKADHPCLSQFTLLCPSYLFLPKPPLNLTAFFLGVSQPFSIIPLTVEPVLLLHPYSPYCPYCCPCMCSEEQILQLVGTVFDFLFRSSEECTEFQKLQSSNKKLASEINSNLVPAADPCLAIKIQNIYNHQVLALFANTSHWCHKQQQLHFF